MILMLFLLSKIKKYKQIVVIYSINYIKKVGKFFYGIFLYERDFLFNFYSDDMFISKNF